MDPPPSLAAGREDIFRSAPMALIQLFAGAELGRDVVGALGSLGLVQFRDLNADRSGFQQQFVAEIRRLDDVLRRLRALEDQVAAAGAELPDAPEEVVAARLIAPHEVDELVARVAEVGDKIGQLTGSRTSLERRRDRLLERRRVLRACDEFFARGARLPVAPVGGSKRGARGGDDVRPLLAAEEGLMEFDIDDEGDDGGVAGAGLGGAGGNSAAAASRTSLAEALAVPLLAGTVARTKYAALERLAWRVTRGNIYMANFPMEERVAGEAKDVFIAYTHGTSLATRVRGLAESMDAVLVKVDNSAAQRRLEIDGANAQLTEVFSVLDSMTRTSEIEIAAVASQLPVWRALVLKERAVYQTLNRFSFDHGRRSLIGEGWCPRDEIPVIQATLQTVSEAAGVSTPAIVHEIHTNRTPPTYHRTNKVTAAFQAIVDVYGIATYQEVNPALPAVVTFPFMFAVMFGDIGHGIILSLAALVLVVREQAIGRLKRDEIFDMAYGGRYVLLFMGLFSLFTGLMYNDIFSKSMTIFSSGWRFPEHEAGESVTAAFTGFTYPIGLDWAWHGADNNLLFTNSFKMKLSILLGFVHMTYSLFFQLLNAQFFDSWVDIVGNFIPGLLFMQSIFGYLSLAILYKWSIDWLGKGWEPPGLLNMIINMFLSPGTIDAPLYRGQAFVQVVLVLLALVCVPWLLLFKPLYLKRQNEAAQRRGYADVYAQAHEHASQHVFSVDDHDDDFEIADQGVVIQDAHDAGGAHGEKFEFSEVMIHQVIHTIEFCLNCVSHTASYLRLWALSLAHNQLSQVLWDMTIANAFGPTGLKGVAIITALFGMWFVGTVVVLVCMEGTSAMLHSLRLHWVEAMSKHFEGEGTAFVPFAFASLEV